MMTNFLASTFILQHASSEYTKVEYTTAIEIYLLVNIFFIMITMLEYMIVLRSHPDICFSWSKVSSKDENISERNIEVEKDTYYNDVTIEGDENQDVACDKSCQVKVKPSRKKDTRKVPDLHNIDRVSRVLIPAVYTIFNITYFSYFLPKGKIDSKE